MQRLELVTGYAVWEKHLIWTLSRSLGDLIWGRLERALGDKEYTCINENEDSKSAQRQMPWFYTNENASLNPRMPHIRG